MSLSQSNAPHRVSITEFHSRASLEALGAAAGHDPHTMFRSMLRPGGSTCRENATDMNHINSVRSEMRNADMHSHITRDWPSESLASVIDRLRGCPIAAARAFLFWSAMRAQCFKLGSKIQ